jgi:hypothetical protein
VTHKGKKRLGRIIQVNYRESRTLVSDSSKSEAKIISWDTTDDLTVTTIWLPNKTWEQIKSRGPSKRNNRGP